MISEILAPFTHTVEVIAILQKPGKDDKSQYYLHVTHEADAVMHLKENGRFEILKARYEDVATPQILLKAYRLFVEALKASL